MVGNVGYSEAELGALNGRQREQLATLTAFGEAVSQDSLEQALTPFIEQDRRSRLLERLALVVEAREAGVDDAELRHRYLQDPEYRLTVRHLVVLAKPYESEKKKKAARDRARAALDRIRAGEPFGRVAGEVSEEPGAEESGGLLPPGRKGTWVKEFWDAASDLQPGEVSAVVQSPYGFHVVKLEKREVVPFDSVRAEVLARVAEQVGKPDAARAWAEREQAELRLDRGAIRRFRSGDTAATKLAVWDGGTYSAAEFESFEHTLAPDALARLKSAEPEAYEQVVRAAAGNALLVDRARSLGLTLDDTTVQRLRSDRLEAARGWASALGFDRGQSEEALKRAALAALSASAQSAAIAREEVLKMAPALRRLHRMDSTNAGGGGT